MAERRDPFAEARQLEANQAARNRVGANPYPPGSELWTWYDEQLKQPGAATTVAGKRNPFEGGPPGSEITPPQQPPRPVYHGTLLPISKDNKGLTYFDPFEAGPIGAMVEGGKFVKGAASGASPYPLTFDPSVFPRAQTSNAIGNILNIAGFGVGQSPAFRAAPRRVYSTEEGAVGERIPNDPSMAQPLSGAQLRQKGGDQRAALEGMPLQYDPHYIGNLWATKLEQIAVDHGASRTNSPQLFNEIDTLRRHTPKSTDPSATIQATPRSILQFRDNVTELYGKTRSTGAKDATEKYPAVQAIHKEIDDFLGGGAPSQAWAPGQNPRLVAAVPHLFENYRGNYAAGAADRELGNIQSEAGVLGRFRGTDPSDTVKNRIASTIIDAQTGRPLSAEMDAQLQQVANQSVPRAIVGSVGRGLSSYGGGAGFALGGAAGHFMGAGDLGWLMAPAVPVLGAGMAKWSGSTAPAALESARTYLRQQAPVQEDVIRGIGYPKQDLVPGAPGSGMLTAAEAYMLAHPQGVPLSVEDAAEVPRPPISY